MTPKICIGRIVPPRSSSLLEEEITLFGPKKFPVPTRRETPSKALNSRRDFRRIWLHLPENGRNSLLFSLFAGNFAETG